MFRLSHDARFVIMQPLHLMDTTRERNRQIIEMREQGISRKDVAKTFKITAGRVWYIEKAVAADKTMATRRADLRWQIRLADDLAKPWPLLDLLDALKLPVPTRKSLLAFFDQAQKTQLTLRELINLAASRIEVPEPGEALRSLFWIRGIGKYGLYSVIDQLTEMDLGQRCNEEWRERLFDFRRE